MYKIHGIQLKKGASFTKYGTGTFYSFFIYITAFVLATFNYLLVPLAELYVDFDCYL